VYGNQCGGGVSSASIVHVHDFTSLTLKIIEGVTEREREISCSSGSKLLEESFVSVS